MSYQKAVAKLVQNHCLTLWLCLILTLPIYSSSNCPRNCNCQGQGQVLCEDNDYDRIPSNLPTDVTTLDMTNNKITRLAQNTLSSLGSVVNLKLKQNLIDDIDDGAFESCEKLQNLDLSGNSLQTLRYETFRGVRKDMQHLDLSFNEIDTVDGAFARMSSLTRLDLQSNRIRELTQFTFRDMTNVRYLLLASNQISKIDNRTFRNVDKLMYLVLKDNPLGQVPDLQFSSTFLSFVDLSESGLTRVPPGLPNSIRYLQLRRNNITTISKDAFIDCPYVRILVLDENGITDIDKNAFDYMVELQQLWLNANHLMKIPVPLPLSLERLLMDSNRVTAITNTFPQGSKLNTLSLMGNNITYIAWNALHRLPNLQSIDLSNNKIIQIYSSTFLNCSQMETLQLSKNPLEFFHSGSFHGLSNLKTLSLAYNEEMEVHIVDDALKDLTHLEKFDLDTSIGVVQSLLSSDLLLGSIRSVQDLSMQSCDLTSLPSSFMDEFPNLKTFHISSSRWHCDRSLLWLKKWLKRTTVDVVQKEDLLCFTPRDVYGRPIISLSDRDFIPKIHTVTPSGTKSTKYPHIYFGSSSTENPHLSTFSPSFITSTRLPIATVDDEIDSIANEEYATRPDTGNGETNTAQTGKTVKDLFPMLTHRLPPWDEIFSPTLGPQSSGGTPLSTKETKYRDAGNREYSDVDIQTLSRSTKIPATGLPPEGRSQDDEVRNTSVTVVVVATSIAIAILVVILVSVTMFWCRRRKQKDVYANAIKYQHRNDILYFMPRNGLDGSTTDSVPTTTSRECMALVPGRDINHEGPLRVYKWEDF